jgi:molybdate transport system substrate-binding protein
MRALLIVVAMLLAPLVAQPVAAQSKPPRVLAAASLQEAMTAAADAWAARRHERPMVSFAASSALARQVEAGAPADLFVSADEEWMDYLVTRSLLAPGTRADFVGNRLVLVARVDDAAKVALRPGTRLDAVLGSDRLAMADPDSVPAGRYGKAAFEHLGVWDALRAKVVRAENVRAALALVERGAARFGVVYATDAKASDKVRVVAPFPADSHPPIRYPLARLKASSSPDAEGFRAFLLSRAGRAIFARFGFSAP